jgi:exodeoxyribonuclease V alpha subunit
VLEELKGTVERITYYSEEDGYTVARFQPEGRSDLITVVGNLMSVNVGASLRLEGFWTSHPKHGRQFKVMNYQTVLPATVEGIRKYLGSGLIKGIGPVTARRIVKHFGLDTLDIIEHHPHRLREVLGVGKKRVEMITRAWEEQRHIKEVMLFLQSHDVSTSLAVKIYKNYGNAALDVVQEDPYRLARDIFGIGFLTADKIARKMGLPTDSPQRVAAGIAYVLNQLADEGNVYAPQGRLIKEATEILDVPPDLVETGVVQLEEEEQVHREEITYTIQDQPGVAIREEQAVYLLPFYYGEVGVANRLRTLINVQRSQLAFYQTANWERVFAHLAERTSQPLNTQQQEAVRTALTHKVTVLTGGPGTGKTTTVRTIIRLLEARRRSYVLASPTGRAAKRLSEATGREAKTVHRLLEFSPQKGFQRNEDHPLDADMVIVDEASMLDLLLTNHLLKAIDPTSHLLLVGDVDQLPSVGAGNVLRDIIASASETSPPKRCPELVEGLGGTGGGRRQVAVVRLEEIFRQAEGSLIVANAHRINRGLMPLFAKGATDFFLFVEEDPGKAADLVVDLVKTRIPRKFGYHPFDDIQVLSPMYRGAVGVSNLNARLQETLNPPSLAKNERRLAGRVFRLGDKVMQTRNNYDKEVYNGDIGRVVRLDLENQIMVVRIDDRSVPYNFSDLDELVHAYAVSVHKSQGSEYPAVVMPVLTQHYLLLQRNLLYTGVTRAEKLVVLVGTRKAIAIAVRNDKIAHRHTALDVRLREA